MTLRIGWFATARRQTSGKLLAGALAAIGDGRLDAEVVVVFCNRDAGEDANADAFHEQVRAAGIPLVTLSSREFRRAAGGEVKARRSISELTPPMTSAIDTGSSTQTRPLSTSAASTTRAVSRNDFFVRFE